MEEHIQYHKTDEEWKNKLTPMQYQVTRCSATERPFTGKYYNHKEKGRYICICCNTELFSSATKYESGSGWPSFYDVIESDRVEKKVDNSHGMTRTEILCKTCGAHLGHVFNDGPKPTGLRYCVNSASLNFIPEEK